jgi:hypothetical protein
MGNCADLECILIGLEKYILTRRTRKLHYKQPYFKPTQVN